MGGYRYYYKIETKGKKNVLYRVEHDRVVKLAEDDDGYGLYQLKRMKGFFEKTKQPLSVLRATEAEILKRKPIKKFRGDNWASTGAPKRIV